MGSVCCQRGAVTEKLLPWPGLELGTSHNHWILILCFSSRPPAPPMCVMCVYVCDVCVWCVCVLMPCTWLVPSAVPSVAGNMDYVFDCLPPQKVCVYTYASPCPNACRVAAGDHGRARYGGSAVQLPLSP